jgi:hypothetical protein
MPVFIRARGAWCLSPPFDDKYAIKFMHLLSSIGCQSPKPPGNMVFLLCLPGLGFIQAVHKPTDTHQTLTPTSNNFRQYRDFRLFVLLWMPGAFGGCSMFSSLGDTAFTAGLDLFQPPNRDLSTALKDYERRLIRSNLELFQANHGHVGRLAWLHLLNLLGNADRTSDLLA